MTLLTTLLEKWKQMSCKHDFVDVGRATFEHPGEDILSPYVYKTHFTLECKKCGKIKKITL